jgi:hypothetical protein
MIRLIIGFRMNVFILLLGFGPFGFFGFLGMFGFLGRFGYFGDFGFPVMDSDDSSDYWI